MALLLLEVDGVTRQMRLSGLSVREYAGGQSNSATVRVGGAFTPVAGQSIKIGHGSLSLADLLFAGYIEKATEYYEGQRPDLKAYDLLCRGYDGRTVLNRRKVNARFVSASASAIAAALIDDFVEGFPSPTQVEAGLDTIPEITFTNEDVSDAIERTARAVGAFWYLDYDRDLHFFVTSTLGGSALAISDATPNGASDLSVVSDLGPVRTRIYVEGAGSSALTDVAVGQTSIPVNDASMFSGSGGIVVMGPQRLTYSGKSSGDGNASTVGGKNISPSTPSGSVVSGTPGGILTGAHRYRVTTQINGGESDYSGDTSDITIADVAAPTGILGSGGSMTATTGGAMAAATYGYELTFYTQAGETTGGGFGSVVVGGGNNAVNFSSIAVSSDARVIGRRLYRQDVGTGGARRLVADFAGNGFVAFLDTVPESSRGVEQPSANTSGCGQIDVSVAVGPTGATARHIYRTGTGGYRRVGTLNDNTTTTFRDNMPDESRGALRPDISAAGAFAGDTSLNVLDLSMFESSGGWVRVSGEVVRYTGRSGSSGQGNLTGVPASGIGSIGSNVSHGTQVVALPSIKGITSSGAGSVLYAAQQGEPVNLLAIEEASGAQTALAALTGFDGIVEEYIRDNRLSQAEAADYADAKALVLKDPIITVRFTTRDMTARPGRTVNISTTSPAINGTFRIQTSTVTQADETGNLAPLRTVEASSVRFSFEQTLALIKYERRL